jgi:hypothetical protein
MNITGMSTNTNNLRVTAFAGSRDLVAFVIYQMPVKMLFHPLGI